MYLMYLKIAFATGFCEQQSCFLCHYFGPVPVRLSKREYSWRDIQKSEMRQMYSSVSINRKWRYFHSLCEIERRNTLSPKCTWLHKYVVDSNTIWLWNCLTYRGVTYKRRTICYHRENSSHINLVSKCFWNSLRIHNHILMFASSNLIILLHLQWSHIMPKSLRTCLWQKLYNYLCGSRGNLQK